MSIPCSCHVYALPRVSFLLREMREFGAEKPVAIVHSAIAHKVGASQMTRANKIAQIAAFVLFVVLIAAAQQQKPFPVTSVVDEPTIAGHPVQLDAQGKLLPWPMPDNIGYSYSSHFLTQWTILWDQYNRQRLPYYYCCFDFDRTTFELAPDPHWVNSTGYLRAMMQGFIERLYPYTGDPRTLTFLARFRRLRTGKRAHARRLCLVAGALRLGESRREALHRMEPTRAEDYHRAARRRRGRLRLSPPL